MERYMRIQDFKTITGCDNTNYDKAVQCTVQLRPPVPSADGCDGFGDDSDDGVCYQVRVVYPMKKK